ncbi:MAG: hypothetical protein AMXMBFR82_05380 [Candidatus Hydrogenedentota bacterium]
MPLIDDLIEPFRPYVDLLVFGIQAGAEDRPQLDSLAKERLIGITGIDLTYNSVASPVSECLLRLARSLVDICESRTQKLKLPDGVHTLAE